MDWSDGRHEPIHLAAGASEISDFTCPPSLPNNSTTVHHDDVVQLSSWLQGVSRLLCPHNDDWNGRGLTKLQNLSA